MIFVRMSFRLLYCYVTCIYRVCTLAMHTNPTTRKVARLQMGGVYIIIHIINISIKYLTNFIFLTFMFLKLQYVLSNKLCNIRTKRVIFYNC